MYRLPPWAATRSKPLLSCLFVLASLAVVGGPVRADGDASRRRRGDKPDQPAEAATQRWLQSLDDEGMIRADVILRAIEAHQLARRSAAMDSQVALMATGPRNGLTPLTAGVAPNRWVWLGPGDVGGRTRSIVIHPKRPNVIWLGSVGGGIWNSQDAGENWFPVDDFMASIAVSCMAVDPTNPDLMLAGTGEGFYNHDAVPGAGVFVSTRRGPELIWERVPGTDAGDFRFVTRVAISADGKAWLASTHAGALVDPSITAQGGLFLRSPSDATWIRVSTAHPPGVIETFYDVRFSPTDAAIGVAASEIYSRVDGTLRTRVYRTADAGRHWTAASGIPDNAGRVELCFAAASPSTVYASADLPVLNAAKTKVLGGGQIYRSEDGGQSYQSRGTNLRGSTPLSVVPYLQGQGWYANTIWAGDPVSKEFLIVGGLDLWRSTDGGSTLEQISDWRKSSGASAFVSPHADQHVITSDGKGGVYFGNDGGVYRTHAPAVVTPVHGWERRNNRLGVTQGFGIAISPVTGECLLGTQDNGTLLLSNLSGSGHWTTVRGGDGGACAADHDALIGEYTFLTLHRRRPGESYSTSIYGGTWVPVGADRWEHVVIPGASPIGDAMTGQANFIAPFVVDPNRSHRVLAGGVSLWVTDDADAPASDDPAPPIPIGPRWRSIKGPSSPEADSRRHSISAIAVAVGDSDLVWVGHNNGALYRTENGTAPVPDWTPVDGGATPLPKRYCTRLVIDPTNKKRVFASYGGYVHGNIHRSDDGGGSWTGLFSDPSLPAVPVRALAIHPKNPAYLYAGTEVGVYASENGGRTWAASNEGPTNCSVEELVWVGTTLVASTHGRGAYKIDLSLLPVPIPAPETFAPVTAPASREDLEKQNSDRLRRGSERSR